MSTKQSNNVKHAEERNVAESVEAVRSELRTFADQWDVILAEDGPEVTRRTFRTLMKRARRYGMAVTDRYPDGVLLEGDQNAKESKGGSK